MGAFDHLIDEGYTAEQIEKMNEQYDEQQLNEYYVNMSQNYQVGTPSTSQGQQQGAALHPDAVLGFMRPYQTVQMIWDEGEKATRPDVIEGMIGSGTTTLIAGAPGSGKSTIMMSILEALQNNADWAGLKTAQCAVWYFTEEKPRTLIQTMKLVGPKPMRGDESESWHQFRTLASLMHARGVLNWPAIAQGIIGLYNEAATYEGLLPGMIVIDTLGKWSKIKNSNDYGEMGEILAHADAIAAHTYASVVVIHHAKKSGDHDSTSIEAVLGSQNIAGTVDQVIVIQKDPEETDVAHIYQVEKRHRGVEPHIAVKLVDGYMERVPVSEGGDKMIKPDDRTIQTMLGSMGEEMSINEIMKATGFGRKKVEGALARLKKAGFVEHNGHADARSAYKITNKEVSLI